MKKLFFLVCLCLSFSLFSQNDSLPNFPTLGATNTINLLSADGTSVDSASFLSRYLRKGGTANFLPKFNANNSAVENSLLYQSTSNNIGINTTSPVGNLELRGSTFLADLPWTTANLQDATTYKPFFMQRVISGSTITSFSSFITASAFGMQAYNSATGSGLPIFIQAAGGALKNTNKNIIGANSNGINGNSLAWLGNQGGYMVAFSNNQDLGNSHGLLVKTKNQSDQTHAFTVAAGDAETAPTAAQHLLTVRGNGVTSIGGSGYKVSAGYGKWMLNIYQGGLYIDYYSMGGYSGAFNYYGYNGSANGFIGVSNDYNAGYSLWANNRIAAAEMNIYSDERIKNILGKSSSEEDLETINAIEITNYTYKDPVAYGRKAYKKVIAQQVEQVYPQAVTKTTGYLPTIFTMAQRVKPLGENTLLVVLGAKTDLQKGDHVKCYVKEKAYIFKVINVTEDFALVLEGQDFPEDFENFFVYGKEVNDYRNVDYDALSMLNVSATQALYKRVKELEKIVLELRKKL